MSGAALMARSRDLDDGEDEIWGTWEELLLACAVARHGKRRWDSIASEVQSRIASSSGPLFTPSRCRQRFDLLRLRFSAAVASDSGGAGGSLFEEPLHDTFTSPDGISTAEHNESSIFPYLLVNIGSGVSMVEVTGKGKFERIIGTHLGGGTILGLARLLTGCASYEEFLELSQRGNTLAVDLTVGDIYGEHGYSKVVAALESVRDIVVASHLTGDMTGATIDDPLFDRYEKLGCSLTPLDKDSDDYKMILKYLEKTYEPIKLGVLDMVGCGGYSLSLYHPGAELKFAPILIPVHRILALALIPLGRKLGFSVQSRAN